MYTFIIEPAAYSPFEDEAAQLGKCKEWGLLSEKAVRTKPFFYKGNGMNEACVIVGYVDKMTAVIEFANGQRHCIHPSYLKEMQAANYGQKTSAQADDPAEPDGAAAEAQAAEDASPESGLPEASPQEGTTPEAEPSDEAPGAAAAEAMPWETAAPGAELPGERSDEAAAENKDAAPRQEPLDLPWDPPTEANANAPSKGTGKGRGKAAKLELPEQKVKMTATVQEFTTVPNNFSDNDDEVVIYEAVSILDPQLEIGLAWSSHSATLKKLELAVGDTITFECKIVAKKLTKHPVPYKINNPAKIQKET